MYPSRELTNTAQLFDTHLNQTTKMNEFKAYGVMSAFWTLVLLVATTATYALCILILPDSNLPSTNYVIAGVIGTLITVIFLIKYWSAWIINPKELQVWWTQNVYTGELRFYTQGSNPKLPWEKRVIDNFHAGVIHVTRTLTEEDSSEDAVTTKDGALLKVDWQFEWWANAINSGGSLNINACREYIKTDTSTKSTGLRAVAEARLTTLVRSLTANEVKDQAETTMKTTFADLFKPDVVTAIEEAYGVVANNAIFKGVIENEQLVAARQKVAEAILAKETQEALVGMDETTLAFLGKIPKKIIELRGDASKRAILKIDGDKP